MANQGTFQQPGQDLLTSWGGWCNPSITMTTISKHSHGSCHSRKLASFADGTAKARHIWEAGNQWDRQTPPFSTAKWQSEPSVRWVPPGSNLRCQPPPTPKNQASKFCMVSSLINVFAYYSCRWSTSKTPGSAWKDAFDHEESVEAAGGSFHRIFVPPHQTVDVEACGNTGDLGVKSFQGQSNPSNATQQSRKDLSWLLMVWVWLTKSSAISQCVFRPFHLHDRSWKPRLSKSCWGEWYIRCSSEKSCWWVACRRPNRPGATNFPGSAPKISMVDHHSPIKLAILWGVCWTKHDKAISSSYCFYQSFSSICHI